MAMSGLPRWLSGKESACLTGDTGSIPILARSPTEGNGIPLQCPAEELMLLNCRVGEDYFVSPLDCKIKPVKPKGNQPSIFIGKTDAESPILWPPDAKSQLIGKDPDAKKD